MLGVLFALTFAAAAHGLITMQPDLAPPAVEPAAVPPSATDIPHNPGWIGWLQLILLAGAPLAVAGLWAADIIRPASFRRRTAAPATNQPWGVLLVTAFLIVLGMGVAGQLAVRDLLPWPRGLSLETNAGRGAVSLVQYTAGVGLALTLAGLVAARKFTGLFSRFDVPVGLLTLGLAFPVVSAVSSLSTQFAQLITGKAPDPLAHEALSKIVRNPDDPWVRVIMAGAILGAPIVEEVMYRLMLQGAVIRLTRSPWIGILITSALFAASHLSGGTVPWHALPALFTLSVALGIVHVRTGRLGPCIVVHMGFNALNVYLALASS